jgi:hypothetical protein
LLHAEHEKVAFLSVNLHSGDNKEFMFLTEPGDSLFIPEPVVFGKADTIESGLFGSLNKLSGSEDTIVGPGLGVGMEVYNHRSKVYSGWSGAL